jgi:hypothetical protein
MMTVVSPASAPIEMTSAAQSTPLTAKCKDDFLPAS